jgi:hypothetical protein
MNDALKTQVLDELNSLFDLYPPKQLGDITLKDIMESRKTSRSTAREIMFKAIELHPDRFEVIKVQPDTKNGASWQWALRRK